MEGASIEGASIEGASIEGASIEGASIEGVCNTPLHPASVGAQCLRPEQ
ncbi:MAG: hypothetical protein F6K47_40960 [Symploca sp. SIO2E6]|nr:hypothetical protein [Symploca sp. SIO2E6]